MYRQHTIKTKTIYYNTCQASPILEQKNNGNTEAYARFSKPIEEKE